MIQVKTSLISTGLFVFALATAVSTRHAVAQGPSGELAVPGIATTTPQYAFTTLDVPGAVESQAYGITDKGEIVGYFRDGLDVYHGFLYVDGIFTTLDAPLASHNRGGGTTAFGVNNRGQIVGVYMGGSPPFSRAFLYENGIFRTLNVPNPDSATGFDTVAMDINSRGAIVGFYFDQANRTHGYVFKKGTFRALDAPGSVGTAPYAIDDRNDIAGAFVPSDATCCERGFLFEQGAFTTFDVPGAVHTRITHILPDGRVLGTDIDTRALIHGFLWQKGVFVRLDVPGARWTRPEGINKKGQIVGVYGDQNNQVHGFIATPRKGHHHHRDDGHGEHGKRDDRFGISRR